MKTLTNTQIELIKALFKGGLLSQDQIAKAFNLSQSTVSRICNPKITIDAITAKIQQIQQQLKEITQ